MTIPLNRYYIPCIEEEEVELVENVLISRRT